MPNAVTPTGIQIQTYEEIVNEILDGAPATLTTAAYPGMRQIYGADINVLPNSPDGQMVNIVAQAKRDMLEYIQQIFTSFDPDQAVGVLLDQRCAINGVQRNQGSYTYVNVNVTVNRALTLQGLDTTSTSGPFTISDSSGNQYFLVATHAFTTAGTTLLSFRAKDLGSITPTINSLTIIVSITLGVVSVNNPAVATTIGTPQESDYALRIRRANAVALPSIGYWQGLYDGLLNTTGVTSALVLENITGTTDANGIPGHSIWCVVAGGANADIAKMIYLKRNAGCGMKGSISVVVPQADGTTFTVKFDRPTTVPLYIKFNATQVVGTTPPDENYIRSQILSKLSYAIGQSADTTAINSLIYSVSPNTSVSSLGVSIDNVTYVPLLSASASYRQFVIASARIIINGNPGA